MKKLLVLILLVTMLLPAVGIAEFDFAGMTDEQLLLVSKELAAELFSREKTAFVSYGRYVVGEHIPEGEYELIWDSTNPENALYKVYENSEKNRKGEYMFADWITEIPDSGSRFALKNGNILIIDGAGVYMKKIHIVINFK